MRHGRGTDLAGFRALFEIPQRDVAPDIAIQVEQYGVGTGKGIKQFGHVIVRLDLDGVRIERQTQSVFNHLAGKRWPVKGRIRR